MARKISLWDSINQHLAGKGEPPIRGDAEFVAAAEGHRADKFDAALMAQHIADARR